MMKRWIGVAAVGLLTVAAVSAAPPPDGKPVAEVPETVRRFPRCKVLRISAAAARRLTPVRAVVDREVFEVTGRLLSDVRVYTREYRELPFRVERMEADRRRVEFLPLPTPVLSEETLPEGRRWVVENPSGAEIGRIELAGTTRAFERRLLVEYSIDRRNWRRNGAPLAVFDCGGDDGLRLTAPDLPPVSARFFRVTLLPAAPERPTPAGRLLADRPEMLREMRENPCDASGIRLLARQEVTESAAPQLQAYPLESVETGETPDGFRIRFDAGRVPLTELRIDSPTPFFVGAATLSGGDRPDRMRVLAEGPLVRLQGRAPAVLPLPESRCRFYELKFQSHRPGVPAPEAPRITARGPGYALVIAPPAAETLRLYFGASLPAPEYDPTELADDRRNPVMCQIGARSNNPEFRPPAFVWDRSVVLLATGGGCILAGILLGGLLFLRGARKQG